MSDPIQTEDGWVWDWVDNSQVPQNGENTVTLGVLDNATVTQGPDKWTGWFQSMAGTIIDYAAKKDLITSGVAPRGTSASGQPVYMTNPQGYNAYGQAQSQPANNTLLLLGLGVALVFALQKG